MKKKSLGNVKKIQFFYYIFANENFHNFLVLKTKRNNNENNPNFAKIAIKLLSILQNCKKQKNRSKNNTLKNNKKMKRLSFANKNTKIMKKVMFVIAILFSLNVFSQEEKIMKILEPYTNFSFLGKSDKVLGADLPSWGMGIGFRYSSIYTPIGLYYDVDLGFDELFPTNTENKTVSAHLFKHDISIGYNYIFDDEHFLHMLSFSVGLGGYNGFYIFSGMNTQNEFPSSLNVINTLVGQIPFKLKWTMGDTSLSLTYRLTIRNENNAIGDININMPALEISASTPLNLRKIRK